MSKKVRLNPISNGMLCEYKKMEMTEGGIILPDQAQHEVMITKVVAVGPDCKYTKPDDLVYLRSGKLDIVELDGEEYLYVTEYQIYGTVDEAAGA